MFLRGVLEENRANNADSSFLRDRLCSESAFIEKNERQT